MKTIPILSVAIAAEHDIVLARQRTRQIAEALKIDNAGQTRLATAVSELARNSFQYADGGRVEFAVRLEPQVALQVRIRDSGPGIAELEAILAGRYRSATGLGLGLVGARRLVDSFEIVSDAGTGTEILLGYHLRTSEEIDQQRLNQWLASLERTAPSDPFAEVLQQNQELLQTQQELSRLNHELEEADRVKDHFLAMLGHEFRNQLGALRNAMQILLRDPNSDKRPLMERIASRQLDYLGRLVEDLLDISAVMNEKLELQRKSLDLRTELTQLIAGQVRQIEAARLLLEVSLPDEPVWALVDPTRWAQIITNLISNAIKFTDPGGRIQIVVKQDAKRSGWARLEITDTGCGLKPKDLVTIFKPFFQTEAASRRMTGGLGLGLPIIKALAEAHGGDLRAYSSGLGRGATFILTLPLEGAPESQAEAILEPPAPREQCILVVDDHRASALSLAELLRLRGHQVELAYDGLAAIEKTTRLDFNVVICDLGLPEIDGFEVARRLRGVNPDLRLIALSGFGDHEARTRAREAGFEVHLTKPVDFERLEDLLTRSSASSLGDSIA